MNRAHTSGILQGGGGESSWEKMCALAVRGTNVSLAHHCWLLFMLLFWAVC